MARSLLSTSKSCCGLGGCKAIFFRFVFRQATVISLRLATQHFPSKGTPHIILQTEARSLYPHARPIRSDTSKTG